MKHISLRASLTIRIGYLVALAMLSTAGVCRAQSAAEFFNKAANEYLYKDDKIALNTIATGLSQHKADQNLTTLKEKILKEKEKQKQDQQQQEQKDQEQEKKEQEKKEQEKKDQQDEKAEDKKDADKKDQPDQAEPKDTDQKGDDMKAPPVSREDMLKDLNLTEEKARMILEAMKNNEIQYIQQNKRKPTKKPDSGKPDW